MAKKWDHSTLLSVFYDPHQADQIVHSRVPRNREANEVHLMAEISGLITNHKPLLLLVAPISPFHAVRA